MLAHLLVLLKIGRGVGFETFGLDSVFLPDDLGFDSDHLSMLTFEFVQFHLHFSGSILVELSPLYVFFS